MEKLLEFPLSIGLLITVLSVSLACIIIVLLTKKLIKNRTTKQHERVGRLLFRVVAGLIALLVSLSYANEKVRQRKIIDSIEMEASIIINISMRLEHFDADQARDASNKLVDYVELTIKDHWKNVEDNPYFSRVTQSLIQANYIALTIPVTNEVEKFEKQMILNDMDDLIKLTQIRVYSHHVPIPYLIYILLCGLAFMWVFFAVYEINVISLSFLTLYNILIAILIFFVFSFRNPFIGPLKIEPHSLIIVKTKGFDEYNKKSALDSIY